MMGEFLKDIFIGLASSLLLNKLPFILKNTVLPAIANFSKLIIWLFGIRILIHLKHIVYALFLAYFFLLFMFILLTGDSTYNANTFEFKFLVENLIRCIGFYMIISPLKELNENELRRFAANNALSF